MRNTLLETAVVYTTTYPTPQCPKEVTTMLHSFEAPLAYLDHSMVSMTISNALRLLRPLDNLDIEYEVALECGLIEDNEIDKDGVIGGVIWNGSQLIWNDRTCQVADI